MKKKIKRLKRDLFGPQPLDNYFKDYDEYWKNRGFKAWSLKRAKLISSLLENEARVLDVGFGDAEVMNLLKKNNKPKELVGIDISKRAVDYAKEKGHEAYVIDVLSKDFKEFLKGKKFDYIIITEVLEHIQDPEEVMVAIRPHVNKAVLITIPNSGFFIYRLRFLMGRFPLVMIQQHIKEHIRFWTHKDFKHWANFLGYKVDRIIATSGMGVKILSPLEKYVPSLFATQTLFIISKK